MKTCAALYHFAAAFAGSVMLTSCGVTTPPLAAAPEPAGVHYTDFVHKGKAYRAKLVVEPRMQKTGPDSMFTYIKATGMVLSWNRKTAAYDIPLTPAPSSRAERGFTVTRLRSDQGKLSIGESTGGSGHGELGIPGWMGETTIALDPPNNSHPEVPVTVKTDVTYRLVADTGATEGPVLANIRVPLSWRVTAKPDSAQELDFAQAGPGQP